ncbi:23S rRNA (uracil-5-)-methyltransferase RumA [Fulvitalea axinellae]|uniref:23S rRNA (Uracil-5-)-methyltransferase RumA n=1 Tax=Fulvitalea axinellae TaxID=1182444 RepID=A0AAU9D4K0_9BACT|nr:23S rRNA (uracil-5-)-methyltransferase RumA [Fulvitalea axinellae]
MARKKNFVIENLTIERVAAEGKCVAHHEDKVIFVEKTVPGDVVDVRVKRNKKSYMEAFPIKFHKESEYRSEPFCSHFGLCGGCKWQNLEYDRQLKWKRQQVVDNFERIGKLEFPEVSPIIGSEATKYYRNKLEFTFANKRWLTTEELNASNGEQLEARGLGFHIPGQYNKVINVDHCYLQPDPSNDIRLKLVEFCRNENIPFYDFRETNGWLRTVVIRTANTGDLMVILLVAGDDEPMMTKVMEFLKSEFPQITSLNYIVNKKGNDSYYDQDVILYHGESFIRETMEDLTYRVGPKSFYQTNSEQAYTLYKVTRDFAKLKGDELVYDLYTGTGTIANFVAKRAKKVVGIEYVPEAIEDAKVNSEINGIKNTRFYAGDMKHLLTDQLVAKHGGTPDVVITDPPRAGMDPKVINMLLKMASPRIVYVSCNPATQARDLALLAEKYEVKAVQPVDMFPHTHHVENVVLLELKK